MSYPTVKCPGNRQTRIVHTVERSKPGSYVAVPANFQIEKKMSLRRSLQIRKQGACDNRISESCREEIFSKESRLQRPLQAAFS
jgi:hypothetical protein